MSLHFGLDVCRGPENLQYCDSSITCACVCVPVCVYMCLTGKSCKVRPRGVPGLGCTTMSQSQRHQCAPVSGAVPAICTQLLKRTDVENTEKQYRNHFNLINIYAQQRSKFYTFNFARNC